MHKNLKRYWQRERSENGKTEGVWQAPFIFVSIVSLIVRKKPNFFITRIRVIKTLYILHIHRDYTPYNQDSKR